MHRLKHSKINLGAINIAFLPKSSLVLLMYTTLNKADVPRKMFHHHLQSQSLENQSHAVRLRREVGPRRRKAADGEAVDLQQRKAVLHRVPAARVVHQGLQSNRQSGLNTVVGDLGIVGLARHLGETLV